MSVICFMPTLPWLKCCDLDSRCDVFSNCYANFLTRRQCRKRLFMMFWLELHAVYIRITGNEPIRPSELIFFYTANGEVGNCHPPNEHTKKKTYIAKQVNQSFTNMTHWMFVTCDYLLSLIYEDVCQKLETSVGVFHGKAKYPPKIFVCGFVCLPVCL